MTMIGLELLDNDVATLLYGIAFIGCLIVAILAFSKKLTEIAVLALVCACGFLPLVWDALAV